MLGRCKLTKAEGCKAHTGPVYICGGTGNVKPGIQLWAGYAGKQQESLTQSADQPPVAEALTSRQQTTQPAGHLCTRAKRQQHLRCQGCVGMEIPESLCLDSISPLLALASITVASPRWTPAQNIIQGTVCTVLHADVEV